MRESTHSVITDAALRVAAEEVAMAMLDDVSAEPHTFSQRFEKKMKRLLRRARHPVGYQVMRYAAAIVLAITVLFGAVFTASPTVRAAVVNWIKSVFHEFSRYSSQETVPPDVEYEYFLPDQFDDYTLLTAIDDESGKTCIFASNEGKILQFTYAHHGNVSMFVEGENCNVYSSTVGGVPADIYISRIEREANVIVWKNPNGDMLLVLSAHEGKEELQRLAEKVEKREIK